MHMGIYCNLLGEVLATCDCDTKPSGTTVEFLVYPIIKKSRDIACLIKVLNLVQSLAWFVSRHYFADIQK